MNQQDIEKRTQTLLEDVEKLWFYGLSRFMQGKHVLYERLRELHKDNFELKAVEVRKETGKSNPRVPINFEIYNTVINKVCDLLLECNKGKALKVFTKTIKSHSSITFKYAIERLVAINSEAAKTQIEKLLHHKDEEICAKIMEEIVQTDKSQEYAKMIIARAQKNAHTINGRKYLAYAIATIDDPEATDVLHTMFRDATRTNVSEFMVAFIDTQSLLKHEQMIIGKGLLELSKSETGDYWKSADTLLKMLKYIAKIKTERARNFLIECFEQWYQEYQIEENSQDKRQCYGQRMSSIIRVMKENDMLDGSYYDFDYSVNMHDHNAVIEMSKKVLENVRH